MRKSSGRGTWGQLGNWAVRGALLLSIGVFDTGCLKKLLLDGQISSTRKASVAVNTLSDWDVAEKAAMAGVAQFEGLRYLAPDNSDALFMLTRSWASIGLGFIEDRMENAEDEHGLTSAEADYEKRRAVQAYERAVWYGKQMLEQDHEGFDEATKTADSMRAYVAQWDSPEDAEKLFWVGYAWLGRVNVQKDKGELVGHAFVGEILLSQSAKLDDSYMYGSVHVALGAYHARSPMAEVEEGKAEFEKAMKIAGDNVLLPKVQFAIRYYCIKGDKATYTKMLNEVLAAGDSDPYQRLPNTIAKRKAARFLGKERMMRVCGF